MRTNSVYLNFTVASACTVATAATVYKWVDENGVTHFSDQPHENAQKVELKAPQTFTAPKTSTPAQLRHDRLPHAAGGEGLSELRHVGADQRPGLPEYRHRFCRNVGPAGRTARRYRARDDGRRTGSRECRPMAVNLRFHRWIGASTPFRWWCKDPSGTTAVLVAQRDVPRAPAVAAVADESDQRR